jgi:hypothetical protein
VTVLALATPARGEPMDRAAEPLVLDAGELDLRLVTEVAVGRDPGIPSSVAPDAWYGVTPRWTVGITHSHASIGLVDAGASLCVHANDLACSSVYRGSQLDVRWSWRDEGALAIALRGRVLVRDVDPFKPALALGAKLRWHAGRFAIAGDPYLRVGLDNRDAGNRDALVVPVWLAVQPACGWLLALHTGIDSELATLRDGWHVPIAGVASVRRGHLEGGVEAGWASLLGPQNDFRRRAVLVTIGWLGLR